MVGCSAVGCSNSSEKGFVMKTFPRDPRRRKEWAERLNRHNWTPTNYTALCEIHFPAEMWEKTRVDGKRKLRANAVPTIFSKRSTTRIFVKTFASTQGDTSKRRYAGVPPPHLVTSSKTYSNEDSYSPNDILDIKPIPEEHFPTVTIGQNEDPLRLGPIIKQEITEDIAASSSFLQDILSSDPLRLDVPQIKSEYIEETKGQIFPSMLDHDYYQTQRVFPVKVEDVGPLDDLYQTFPWAEFHAQKEEIERLRAENAELRKMLGIL